MPNTFTLKKSAVANKVPITTDLSPGEIAINTTDGRLYYLHSSSVVGEINASDARTVGGINPSTFLRNNQSGTLNGGLTVTGNVVLSGSSLTLNATSYTYGSGAAAAQRTALGLGTAATTDSSAYANASHSHGNITNAGAIGSTSDQVVTTTTGGVLTTSSRSGIDSRTSFPNSDVTAAASLSVPNTLVRRDANSDVSFDNINIEGAVNTGDYIFTRFIEDYIGDDPVYYAPTLVLTPEAAFNSDTTTITFPARNGTVLLSDEVSVASSGNKIVKRDANGHIFGNSLRGNNLVLNNDGYISIPITVFVDEGENSYFTTTNTIIEAQQIGDATINVELPAESGVIALTSQVAQSFENSKKFAVAMAIALG